jgi:hypothetical protein
MGTVQGADAPDNHTPPGVGGLTAGRAVVDLLRAGSGVAA